PALFLVHSAIGLAFDYVKLAGLVERPVYGIHNPYFGLMERFNSLEDMADAYIDFIREVQPHGPYCLGGHSFGGVVALVMAEKLVTCDEEIEQVILFDSICVKDGTRSFNDSARFIAGETWVRNIKGFCVDPESSNVEVLIKEVKHAERLLSQCALLPYSGAV
ncbi:unnamed protein product, partial [Didymodactylos carnosus]